MYTVHGSLVNCEKIDINKMNIYSAWITCFANLEKYANIKGSKSLKTKFPSCTKSQLDYYLYKVFNRRFFSQKLVYLGCNVGQFP